MNINVTHSGNVRKYIFELDGDQARACAEDGYRWFVNRYECDCGEAWDDEWSCMCNDRCPACNAEIEPYDSDEFEVIR